MRRVTAALALLTLPTFAAALELQLPLGRKAYQTNEDIELAVIRTGAAVLPAGEMTVTATAAAGGKMTFVFPAPAVDLAGKEARRTDHVRLNGRLMRPGNYTIEVIADGQAASTKFELYSHVRRSTFKIVDWGSRAAGAEQAALGEDGMGFNLLLASYGGLSADDVIRAGMDYIWCCTMSGGHQMDLRLECDWSDPVVLRGGTARVVRRAFQDRTNPNCLGVHFYDEPGLTWHKHPVTGEFTPHGVPAQVAAYRAAFGKEPPDYSKVNPNNPRDLADWLHWGRWKLGFMEAAWKDAAFGVTRVKPDFLPMNQAVYGWSAYTDGYYFNISRALPVLGGHGGYDDYGGLYFNPSYTLEFGRARDLARPNWYLPTWYEGTPPDRFRLEQYLSFMNNIQGMMKPPDMQVHRPGKSSASQGIVESNKLMARLGTIFTTMPVTRPPVAVLYSMSQNLRSQAKDRSDNYEGGGQRDKTLFAYLAGKTIHQPLFPVVEEDVLDGSVAAHHQAILLPGTAELDPRVIRALEEYITGGGRVLLSDDSKVTIKGAEKVGAPIDTTFSQTLGKLYKENKQAEIAKFNTVGNLLKSNEAFAAALKSNLAALGILPLVECDNPGIVVSKQGGGDVEYVFAVNASYDAEVGDRLSLKSATATLSLGSDAKHVYDAVLGGKADGLQLQGGKWTGHLRFGPGQMRVFAITSEPIAVKLSRPVVRRDYTQQNEPLAVEAAAAVHGLTHVLAGSVPLRVRLMDPNGAVRYDLYRATESGVCPIKLPLAANDPPGTWRLQVRELLGNDEQTLAFEVAQPKSCGAAAGTVARAISFGNDRDNIYRFFRTWKDVTIVKGSSDYNAAAVERLAKALVPWGVRFQVVNAADVKPRELTEEEAKTWVGLTPSKPKAGKDNPPGLVGFDVRGAVLLLGTPEDNPLIAFLQTEKFLPYKPAKGTLPGTGRGYLAWQRDGISYDQESVTLIAHDAVGMAEAVGTLAEVVAGLNPLMPSEPPLASSVEAVGAAEKVRGLEIRWQVQMPDRIVGFGRPGLILSADGTVIRVNRQHNVEWKKALPVAGALRTGPFENGGALMAVATARRIVRFSIDSGTLTDDDGHPVSPGLAISLAVGGDGSSAIAIGATDGSLRLFDAMDKEHLIEKPKDGKLPPNPFTAGALDINGEILAIANEGTLLLIDAKTGNTLSRIGGANGRFGVHHRADWFIVSDGSWVRWISTKTKRVERTMPVPPGGVSHLRVIDSDSLIVGSEDGTVRWLRYVKEGAKPVVAWEHKQPNHVVKHIAFNPSGSAVAYWGGLVQIIRRGDVTAEARFDQDVTALAESGDGFLIGLADGRVISVK